MLLVAQTRTQHMYPEDHANNRWHCVDKSEAFDVAISRDYYIKSIFDMNKMYLSDLMRLVLVRSHVLCRCVGCVRRLHRLRGHSQQRIHTESELLQISRSCLQ